VTTESIGEAPDSGLAALSVLLAVHRIAVDPAHLRHELGHSDRATTADLLRIAKRLQGVKARIAAVSWSELARCALPAIAIDRDGTFFLLGQVKADAVLVQEAFAGAPSQMSREAFESRYSGELLLMTTRESAGVSGGAFDVSWFIPQIVKYRNLMGEVLLVTLAVNILGLAAPLFFQNVIDKVLVHNTLETLNVLFFGFVAVSFWEVAFGWLRTRLYSETTLKIDVELGAKLFRHLLHLPLSYFEVRRVGDTVTRVRELETVREFLTNTSMTVLIDPLFSFVFLIAMWVYSPTLLLIVLVTIPLYVLISIAVTGPLRTRLNEKFERGAANNALLVESVSGMQTLKAAAVEPQWQDRWERQLAGYVTASMQVVNLGNSGNQAIQLINKLSMAAILFFGAKAVIGHELTVGALVAFNMFANRVSGPVLRMAQLWQEFQQVRVAIQRLGDVLNVPTEPGAGSRTALPALKGAVSFERVSFRYGTEGPLTLENIDLSVSAGEVVGICGPSGSGKSTLTKLIQRLHTPQAGRIFVDGVDIASIDPAWLRRQIGVVLQENVLFNRSVRENIALSNPAMPMQAVMAASQLAGAHDFVLRLPQGYDTVIEERGANLSGGQRQRLAIARALVTQPRILIFDEATSALDAESEEIVQANMRAMSRGRTVIIIAHRLSAIRGCDRILTIEDGRIVETGSHDELLLRNGRYSQLYRKQMGIIEAAE
jgi:subfamily B ATP-binding cassette protein HlyB/CyaB